MKLRVMTWNVHGLRGADGRRDPGRVAEVIAACGPDVAGLQEVGTPAAPGAPDAARALGSLTGLEVAFGPVLPAVHGFAYGNAVLSRHPIEATRTYDLSVPGREPRCCLRADLALPDARLHVLSAHLGLGFRERRWQAAALVSADVLRDAALAYPLVLVGDFNSLSHGAAAPRRLRRLLADCALAAGAAAPTFPARLPLLRLDHVYASAALAVHAVRVIRSASARRASDHLPVVADLELLEAAARPPVAREIEAPGVSTALHRDGRPPRDS